MPKGSYSRPMTKKERSFFGDGDNSSKYKETLRKAEIRSTLQNKDRILADRQAIQEDDPAKAVKKTHRGRGSSGW